MRIWPRFSAQAFRNQADNRPNRRDLYMESSFCRCFPVQARLVQEPSSANEPSQDITKTPRISARRLERKTRLELAPSKSLCIIPLWRKNALPQITLTQSKQKEAKNATILGFKLLGSWVQVAPYTLCLIQSHKVVSFGRRERGPYLVKSSSKTASLLGPLL